MVRGRAWIGMPSFRGYLFSITQLTQAFNISEIFEHSDTLSPRGITMLSTNTVSDAFHPPQEKRTLMIMRWGFPKWWTGGVLTRPALVTQVPTVFWNLRNTMFLLFLALCGSEEQGSVESFHRPELLPGVTLAHVTLVHTYKMVNGFLSPCYSRLHPSIPNRHYSHNVFSSS